MLTLRPVTAGVTRFHRPLRPFSQLGRKPLQDVAELSPDDKGGVGDGGWSGAAWGCRRAAGTVPYGRRPGSTWPRGRSSMVEPQPSKLVMRFRLPSPALYSRCSQVSTLTCWTLMTSWPSYVATVYQMVTPSAGNCSSYAPGSRS